MREFLKLLLSIQVLHLLYNLINNRKVIFPVLKVQYDKIIDLSASPILNLKSFIAPQYLLFAQQVTQRVQTLVSGASKIIKIKTLKVGEKFIDSQHTVFQNIYNFFKYNIAVFTTAAWFGAIPFLFLLCLITYVPQNVCNFLLSYVDLKNTTFKEGVINDQKLFFFSRWSKFKELLLPDCENITRKLIKIIGISNFWYILNPILLYKPLTFLKIGNFKKSLIQKETLLSTLYEIDEILFILCCRFIFYRRAQNLLSACFSFGIVLPSITNFFDLFSDIIFKILEIVKFFDVLKKPEFIVKFILFVREFFITHILSSCIAFLVIYYYLFKSAIFTNYLKQTIIFPLCNSFSFFFSFISQEELRLQYIFTCIYRQLRKDIENREKRGITVTKTSVLFNILNFLIIYNKKKNV